MSRHSKRSIKILNPVEGGATHTTRRSARRYVDAGRAQWVNGAIEFVAACPVQADKLDQAPRFNVVQMRSCEYRNAELGLPNFVGFLKQMSIPGRRVAA